MENSPYIILANIYCADRMNQKGENISFVTDI